MEDYQWTLLDNDTVSCGLCPRLNATLPVADDVDESFLHKMSLLVSWKEDVACSCSSCQCDLQLALCLQKVGHCAPMLFGVPDFVEHQMENIGNFTSSLLGKATSTLSDVWNGLTNAMG